jgi:hypothetical protein
VDDGVLFFGVRRHYFQDDDTFIGAVVLFWFNCLCKENEMNEGVVIAGV